jgi:hypothetical protein
MPAANPDIPAPTITASYTFSDDIYSKTFSFNRRSFQLGERAVRRNSSAVHDPQKATLNVVSYHFYHKNQAPARFANGFRPKSSQLFLFSVRNFSNGLPAKLRATRFSRLFLAISDIRASSDNAESTCQKLEKAYSIGLNLPAFNLRLRRLIRGGVP